MAEKFQVHLQGIIDLLAKHLYKGPDVFIRELLQNAHDAITAREASSKNLQGVIRFESIRGPTGSTLIVQDNGIGLTEPEVYRFLATIGDSSKRIKDADEPSDFIGRFGVGLLSCFMVSEEIAIVTQSIHGSAPVSWRGKEDGTYTTTILDREMEPGTSVFLTSRAGSELYFETKTVEALVRKYGWMLGRKIEIVHRSGTITVNGESIPWRKNFLDSKTEREAYHEFGKQVLEESFMDYIPLWSPSTQTKGVAYILSQPVGVTTKQRHRVHIKGMFVCDNSQELLPSWAVFVQAIVDSQLLRPTASRDSLYPDERLESCCQDFGRCIQSHLIRLANERPEKLANIVKVHINSIRALAIENDDCYRTFIEYIPFETTEGTLTLPEFRKIHSRIYYVNSVEQFRQISQVASAHGIGVINGGYYLAVELLLRYGEIDQDVEISILDPETFSQVLDELTGHEREYFKQLITTAERVLSSNRCRLELRSFIPAEIAALYTLDREAQLMRSIDHTLDVSNSLFADVLNSVKNRRPASGYATLVLNARNLLVRKLAETQNIFVVEASVKSLYAQSLLMSHQPMSSAELRLLSTSLSDLMLLAIENQSHRTGS